ncbi:MAG: hypothetical protein AB1643_02585 [Patescibacteria group bacterium]
MINLPVRIKNILPSLGKKEKVAQIIQYRKKQMINYLNCLLEKEIEVVLQKEEDEKAAKDACALFFRFMEEYLEFARKYRGLMPFVIDGFTGLPSVGSFNADLKNYFEKEAPRRKEKLNDFIRNLFYEEIDLLLMPDILVTECHRHFAIAIRFKRWKTKNIVKNSEKIFCFTYLVGNLKTRLFKENIFFETAEEFAGLRQKNENQK